MNIFTFSRPALVGAALIAASFAAQAQVKDVVVDGKGEVPYAIDARNTVARSGTGLCWRTGFFSPAAAGAAMAGEFPAGCACDSDLVPKEKCTAPMAQAPAAAPAPAPAPAPAVKKVTLSAKALFGFNKANLTPAGKAEIDKEVIAKLPQVAGGNLITVSGHTDRLGSQQYNQALSEQRAMAVRNYLVEKGVSADMIDAVGYGKTQPVGGVNCADSLGRAKLIECLAPHRRVEVEIKGAAK